MIHGPVELRMCRRRRAAGARRLAAIVAVGVLAAACQGWDRLEPDRRTATEEAADRGTLFDATGGPESGTGGRLTQEIASRRLRQIEGAGAEQRLRLADQFLSEYPDATIFSYLHEMVGDAHRELGDATAAAHAYEAAIEMSWPAPDLLGLPLTALELPYQVGWARFDAGDPALGAEWLTRATFISDRDQLEQGLRFMYAELGAPGGSFDAWLTSRRAELAKRAPDFELPGYQVESLRLDAATSRLTLINFWSPT